MDDPSLPWCKAIPGKPEFQALAPMRLKVQGQGGLTLGGRSANLLRSHGDIAQLGERLDGIEKVRGSSPLISMNVAAAG